MILIAKVDILRAALRPFGLDNNLVVDFLGEDPTHQLREAGLPSLETLGPFDLLVDLRYDLPQRLFLNFRRKVLINIDPGLYEQALAGGGYPQPTHDLLFSIGESAGKYNGRNWIYTQPCVYLDEWPFVEGARDAPWTTVAHWWTPDTYYDSKREGFKPFMSIPSKVDTRFELALSIGDKEEQERIESYGFTVHDPYKILTTTSAYRTLIQKSAGEFSCAKPPYVKLQTAWVSDRTLCYLATGRPCIVQNTGPSHFLPNNKGLHRFSDFNGAVKAFETVLANYESESNEARVLAEEFFDAHKVCGALLARALG